MQICKRGPYHYALWQIGLRDDDRSKVLECLHDLTVLSGWLVCSRTVAERGVEPPDVELILHGHRNTMEGPK